MARYRLQFRPPILGRRSCSCPRTGPPRADAPHLIIGVTADIDDEHVVPEPILTVYNPFEEGPIFGGRLFIHTDIDPYSLVTPVTRIIRDKSPDQPMERAAT